LWRNTRTLTFPVTPLSASSRPERVLVAGAQRGEELRFIAFGDVTAFDPHLYAPCKPLIRFTE